MENSTLKFLIPFKKPGLLIFLLFILCGTSSAQEKNATISGIVESDKGGTLPGVSVDLKMKLQANEKLRCPTTKACLRSKT
ncbi:hypothetical protein [Pedobacter sp. NJ-S-72]